MDKLRESFDEKADMYDTWIQAVCPFYKEVLAALVSYCPENIRYVLDLGCGSGSVAQALLETFPMIHATLVDLSAKMLSTAKNKLMRYGEQVEYIEKDIATFSSNYKYDVIIASLAMHHLDAKQKGYFCEKVLAHLVPGGYFFVIEQVLGGTRHIQEKTHNAWLDFMKEQGLSDNEIHEMIERKKAHDRCEPLMQQLTRLKKIGFVGLDVLFKRDSIVLFAAQKY
jgi:tRNA (cmo5U34)-methyltransferase